MTDVLQSGPAAAPGWFARHRRATIWTSVSVAVVLVAGLAVWLVLRHLDGRYGPIEGGSEFGVGESASFVRDGSGLGGRLEGAGTLPVYTTVDNGGSHSVRITGIGQDDVLVGSRWAPMPVDRAHVAAFGPHTAWRPFPATVAAGAEIQIETLVHRPRTCSGSPMQPGAGEFVGSDIIVHWDSLLGSHTTAVSLLPPDELIQVC